MTAIACIYLCSLMFVLYCLHVLVYHQPEHVYSFDMITLMYSAYSHTERDVFTLRT